MRGGNEGAMDLRNAILGFWAIYIIKLDWLVGDIVMRSNIVAMYNAR